MAKKTSALGKLNDSPALQQPVANPQSQNFQPVSQPKENNGIFVKKNPIQTGSSPLNKLSEQHNKPQTVKNNDVVEDREESSSPKKPLFPKKQKKQKPEKKTVSTPEVADQPTPAPTPNINSEPESIDYEKLDEELVESEVLIARKERKYNQRKAFLNKLNAFVLVAGCVYLIFLIYGALNTQYTYNDDGKVVPQVMTVEEIQKLNDFNVIATDYRQARLLYEEVLKLDYRIAAGIEDPLLVAPEYESILDKVEETLIQSQALSVTTQYTQVHSMINTWLSNDIAIYCQKMSSAISKNNVEDATLALKYKNIVYNDFSIITANITAMGSVVNGAEIADIESWSPEKYINSQVGEGIGGT